MKELPTKLASEGPAVHTGSGPSSRTSMGSGTTTDTTASVTSSGRGFVVVTRVEEQATLFGLDGTVAAAFPVSYVEELTVQPVAEAGGQYRWRICRCRRVLR